MERNKRKAVSYIESDDDLDEEVLFKTKKKNKEEKIIEKILGYKVQSSSEGAEVFEETQLFYIKWKGKSYIHASWETREYLEEIDPSGRTKLKRYLTSRNPRGMSKNVSIEDDDEYEEEEDNGETYNVNGEIEYFNPECLEVQRIIACSDFDCIHKNFKTLEEFENSDDQIKVKYYVKWRSLPYNEATWEDYHSIKTYSKEIALFWSLQIPPSVINSSNSRPSLQSYKKLNVSPAFGISSNPFLKQENFDGLQLRDYQLEGLNWLLWNWWNQRSCILADEMGLGKTIQTVSFLHQLRFMETTKIPGPFIIIAPLSLVDQWYGEISTWSPDMNTILLHGNQDARDIIMKNEFYYNEPFIPKSKVKFFKEKSIFKFHILLTTYEVAAKEISTLSNINWEVMIIDEAHKLKNVNSQIFGKLSTINSKRSVLLTGTPLQNKTEELFALLHFADRKNFTSSTEFVEEFGDLKSVDQVKRLHDMLKPYLLRRIKEDVEKSLPPKEETIVEVALTSLQKRFYRAIYEKNTSFLFKGLKSSNQPSLMNIMMELRKCCNHPYLVKGVEERVMSELSIQDQNNDDIVHKNLIESSGKLVLLDKLLPKLFSQGHKVLIFSQMVKVLNLLEDFLKYRGYTFERLDGSTRSIERKEAVDKFCSPTANRFIMLLSTKAGGLGLNLTVADTVIIYDSDWNPQNDLQAQARAHRIGQTRAVKVYRLLTHKTYEMEMFHQASMKLGLDRAVLAHARSEGKELEGQNIDTKLNLKEIDALLKRGAYDVFREDDSEQKEFVEADIDSILERSKKVTYNSSGTISSSLGSFSKASFVSADDKEEVDINDSEFWRKAVGLKEENSGELLEEDVQVELPSQRNRKQTSVYGNNKIISDEVDKLLKPLKPDKSLKELNKQNALKEKLEREEARKQKLLDEAKMKEDPRHWGAHGRDRVIRAISLFGPYRWEKVRIESGKLGTELSQLNYFYQSYLLQCGMAAGEIDSNRGDTPFILECIQSYKDKRTQIKEISELNLPASLTDQRFLSKLKGGNSKKSLSRIDCLIKLTELIYKAIETCFNKNNNPYHQISEGQIPEQLTQTFNYKIEEIDEYFGKYSVAEVCSELKFGDSRPSWANVAEWWDVECDKHLVYGSFKHGFGRYESMKDDDELIFKSKISQYLENPDCNIVNTGVSNESNNNLNNSIIEDGENEDQDDMDVDDEEQTSKRKISSNSASSSSLGQGGMPDSRQLNKLLNWLVSSELAIRTKKDIDEDNSKNRKEKRLKNGIQSASAAPSNTVSSLLINSLTESRSSKKDFHFAKYVQKFNSLKSLHFESLVENSQALQEFQLVYNSHKDFFIFSDWISNFVLDQDSFSFIFNPENKNLIKCEKLLRNEFLDDQFQFVPFNDDFISESEVKLLISYFVVHGAPIKQNFPFNGIDSLLLMIFGIKSDNLEVQSFESENSNLLNWEKIKSFTKVDCSAELIEKFYHSFWIPLCSKSLNPISEENATNDEKVIISRGLCQLFIFRMQLIHIIFYLISYQLPVIIDFLTTSSTMRVVDYLPVWWCPWIHDLGLLLGILKHGYLNLDKIYSDPDLPFNKKYLEVFIKRVFLQGWNQDILPIGKWDISNSQTDNFIKFSLLQYPDRRDLELRLVKLLEEILKFIPSSSISNGESTTEFSLLSKLLISYNLYRTFLLQASSLSPSFPDPLNDDLSIGVVSGRGKSSKGSTRPPGITLKSFLNGTRKRRKVFLSSYHADCL